MTSGFFVNGNKSVRTVNNDGSDISNGDLPKKNEARKKRIVRKSSQMPSTLSKQAKRKKTSGFKRYETCAPKLKKLDFSDSESDSECEYQSQDENVSDCDHDNPAGVLIELYK